VTPYDLLLRRVDPTRPLVTHYDGPAGRVELSAASVANAVAKAASMLRDGLGLAPDAVVSVDLPRHWQLPVWVMAGLSVGARVGRGLPDRVDVRVLGPEGLDRLRAGVDPAADDTLVASCDAFGMPVPGGVPAGVIDIAVEVRAHPDRFRPEPAAGGTAALIRDGVPRAWSQLDPGSVPPGARLWVDGATPERDLLDLLVVRPLLLEGSVVIGMDLDPAQVAAIQRAEGVTPGL